MQYTVFHIIHLVSVFLFVGVVFAALASPMVERRSFYLSCSGVTALLVFLSGFGLLGIMKLGVPFWAWVKAGSWLTLSALPGLAYRRPNSTKQFAVIGALMIVLSVVMVSIKPL